MRAIPLWPFSSCTLALNISTGTDTLMCLSVAMATVAGCVVVSCERPLQAHSGELLSAGASSIASLDNNSEWKETCFFSVLKKSTGCVLPLGCLCRPCLRVHQPMGWYKADTVKKKIQIRETNSDKTPEASISLSCLLFAAWSWFVLSEAVLTTHWGVPQ